MTPADFFSLRTATRADEAAIETLLGVSYPAHMGDPYDEGTLARALPRITRIVPALLDSGTFYAALATGGEMVGCGGWTREPPDGGEVKREVGHIRQFATHPDWTRKGVGRAVFEACERDALRLDLRRLEVLASLNSEGFYKALGFARKRRVAVRLGEGVFLPAVLMRKALA